MVYEEMTVMVLFELVEKCSHPQEPDQSSRNFIISYLQNVRSKISSASSSLPSVRMKKYLSGTSNEKKSSLFSNENSALGKDNSSDAGEIETRQRSEPL